MTYKTHSRITQVIHKSYTLIRYYLLSLCIINIFSILFLNSCIADLSEQGSTDTKTLIVFISNSIPVASLKNYYLESKKYKTVFLMRGLVENSFQKTKSFTSSIDDGMSVQINEEAFRIYDIKVVPTIVLAHEKCRFFDDCNITYDKIEGNLSIRSALEIFKDSGDTKLIAQAILKCDKDDAE